MFGLEDDDVEMPPTRSQAAPQGRFLAGDDPVEYKTVSWQMLKLRTLPKLTYKGYRLYSDDKGNKVEVSLDAGTPIRVYSGKIPVTLGDKSYTINSPNDKGESFVETLPDDKSRFWNFYPNTPEYQTLMQSQAFKDTAADRGTHLMWLPLNMKSDSPPDLLDEAVKAQYDAIALPEKKAPATPADKTAGKPDATKDTLLSVALGVGGAFLLASLLDSRKK